MVIRFYLYYTIISVIFFSCEFDLPPDKTLKTCQKPTGITATVDATDAFKYTFTINGFLADISGQLTWKIQKATGELVTTLTSTVTNPIASFTFSQNGNYNILLEAKTLCQDNISLNTPINVQRVCQKPTNITATGDATNPLKYTLSLAGNTSEITGQVTWKVVSGSTVLTQTQASATNPINILLPGGGTYTVIAEAQTTCNDKATLNQEIVLNGVYKIWDKTYGGSESDSFSTMLATSDGGYLLAGSSVSNSSGEKSESSRGSSDFWIIKVNSDGVKMWDKTYGGTAFDALSTILPTADGGFLVAGWSNSNISNEKTVNSRGDVDYWIMKINSSGVKLWDKTFGGNNTDALQTVSPTTDGGFLLGGWSSSTISGEKTEGNRGGNDYWIVKVTSDGTKQWDKTFGGTSEDILVNICQTSDGGFLLGGYSSSNASNEKNENSRGLSDFWVVKINANGVKQWDKIYGGVDKDELQVAISTDDAGFLLGGWSESSISSEKSENNKGGRDYWIVKINASGTKQWDKTFGGAGDDDVDALLQTVDGNFMIGGGSSSSSSNDKSDNNRGDRDYWLLKISGTGQKLWDKTFGGLNYDFQTEIKATPDGGFILGGTSTSNAGFDKSENSRGGQDYWIIKVK